MLGLWSSGPVGLAELDCLGHLITIYLPIPVLGRGQIIERSAEAVDVLQDGDQSIADLTILSHAILKGHRRVCPDPEVETRKSRLTLQWRSMSRAPASALISLTGQSH